MGAEKVDIEGENNVVEAGENIDLRGKINGRNNRLIVEDAALDSIVRVIISGSFNTVHIGKNSRCRGLDIRIGNHVVASDVNIRIGEGFSSENDCKFLLYNSGNTLTIGDDCMFSNSIILRCGESPHLIFDDENGDYLDVSDGVEIGDHVWIGERSYITKRAKIASGCIVAACAVATKTYSEEKSVIAGNPGRIVRTGVNWVRNRGKLIPETPEALSYKANTNKYHNRKRVLEK